tara:strand:- start:502 stop:765 length:264 start_codon:yes stop_codon:yes gene_type:complete
MKWFVFVLFMTTEPGEPNAYLFTTPEFNSQQECAMAVVNPQMTSIFVTKLIQEFGAPPPQIRTISCITEETIKKIDKMNVDSEGIST